MRVIVRRDSIRDDITGAGTGALMSGEKGDGPFWAGAAIPGHFGEMAQTDAKVLRVVRVGVEPIRGRC